MPAARKHDVETSHLAASTAYNPNEVHKRILDILKPADFFARSKGLTDEEIVEKYQERGGTIPTAQSIRSRRAELVQRGAVVWTGQYGQMRETGRKTRRWKAVR